MTKHFCDICGDLIEDYRDDETELNNRFNVFGSSKDICPLCREYIKDFLDGKERKVIDELTTLKSLVHEMFERERTLKATYLSSDSIKGVAWKVWDDTEMNEIKDKLWEAVNK
jgi:hypothetical protein